jgi:hypothetical protein
MSCPKCGSDDWKMASIVHADAKGQLKDITRPPKPPPEEDFGIGGLLFIFIVNLFVIKMDWKILIFIYLFLEMVSSLINSLPSSKNKKEKEKNEYELNLLKYQKTKVCLRCWTLFEN